MNNVLPLSNVGPSTNEPKLHKCSVVAVTDTDIMIHFNGQIIPSKQALSCLVAPQMGDLVLLSIDSDDCFILSVLKREASQNVLLKFPENLDIVTPKGKVRVLSHGDIELTSANKATVVAKSTSFIGDDISMLSKRLSITTNKLEANADNAHLTAKSIDTVAMRISQKADTVVRWVENIEILHLGNLVQNIRKTITSHSNQAVIIAKKDMRIDGERIHMG